MVEHVARTVEINVFRFLVGKATGNRMFGKHSCEWVYNIQIDLKEIWSGSWNVYQGQNKNKKLLLWKCFWIFLFHQMRGMYCLADEPVASYTQLCAMEW